MYGRAAATALGLALCVLAMPLLLMGVDTPREQPAPTVEITESQPPADELYQTPSPEHTSAPSAVLSADSQVRLMLLNGGQASEVTLAEYLPLVLAAEMPASFETEALKAQAVAARTYTVYSIAHSGSKHPLADICTDSTCCQAWLSDESLRERWGESYDMYMEKLRAACLATDGEYLVYGGEPALAVFHSSSSGVTEASGSIWSDLPYLVSVDSPEGAADVPGYVSSVSVSPENFRSAVLSVCPAAVFGDDPADWLGGSSVTCGSRVDSVTVGGAAVSGASLRSALGLRSTAFTLVYAGGQFIFTVTGFGHGVGMSQYGANVLAQGGADYRSILMHYYTGVEIGPLPG